MYFLHFSDSSRAVVHLDPDHQPVLGVTGHFVEELKTLELSLRVQDSGFEQRRLHRFPGVCAEVHKVSTVYKVRQSETMTRIINIFLTNVIMNQG